MCALPVKHFTQVLSSIYDNLNLPWFVFLQREVVLYLSVNKGKVAGAKLPPFELPYRWTYETLVHCIKDHMARRTDAGSIEEIVINQLYYRRSRGKTVVVLNDDQDVSSLLSEYPLMTQKDGTKRARMYLAIDYHKHGKNTSCHVSWSNYLSPNGQ